MIFSGQFRVLHGIFNSHCGQLQFRMQESHGIAILIILLSNWARISKMGAHFQTAVGPQPKADPKTLPVMPW